VLPTERKGKRPKQAVLLSFLLPFLLSLPP